MSLPIVPRSTYEAAISQRDERIAELKARLAKVEEELKLEKERMADLMACRAIGQTIYGHINPPKIEEDEPEPAPRPSAVDPATLPLPTALESDIEQVGSRARTLKNRAERRNLAEIEEAERALELAREAGRELAQASSNGNH